MTTARAIVTVIDYRLPAPRSVFLINDEPITIGHDEGCNIFLPTPRGGAAGGILATVRRRSSSSSNNSAAESFDVSPLHSDWNEPTVMINYGLMVMPGHVSGVNVTSGDVVYVHFDAPHYFGFQILCYDESYMPPNTQSSSSAATPEWAPEPPFDFSALPRRVKMTVFSNFDAHELMFLIAPVCREFFDLVTCLASWDRVVDVDEMLYGDGVVNACYLGRKAAKTLVLNVPQECHVPPWAFSDMDSPVLKDVSIRFHSVHSNSPLPQSFIPMLSRCTTVRCLRLINFSQEIRGFGYQPLTNLRHLTLRMERENFHELLDFFAGLGFGTEAGFGLNVVSMQAIFSGLPNLTYLSLGFGFAFDSRWAGQPLPAFSSLRLLSYRETVFSRLMLGSPYFFMRDTLTCLRVSVDAQMENIARLTKLKVLCLDGPYQLTTQLEPFFRDLQSPLLVLKVVDSATFNDNCLHNIARNQPGLEALILESCREITDAGLAAMLEVGRRLKFVQVAGTRGLEGTSWLSEVDDRSEDFLHIRVTNLIDVTNVEASELFQEGVNWFIGPLQQHQQRRAERLHIVQDGKYPDCWKEDFDPAFFLPELLEKATLSMLNQPQSN